MVRPQGLRRNVLLLALGLTVVAIIFPVDEGEPRGGVSKSAIKTRPTPQFANVRNTSLPPDSDVRSQWLASDQDPFAARSWVPAPPTEVNVPQRVEISPAVVTTPPPPSPLPFKVLGQMVDGNDQVVYLKTGEQVLLARLGDVLEGTYRVVAVSPTQIEFESTDAGLRQSLPLLSQDN